MADKQILSFNELSAHRLIALLFEMTVEESLAGAGFEVAFEFYSLLIIREFQSNQQFPGAIFGRMWRLSLIVGLGPVFQVAS